MVSSYGSFGVVNLFRKGRNVMKVIRIVGNLFISAAWFWVFDTLGWISFGSLTIPFWQAFILSALVAWLIQSILDWVYVTFILVTCCLGCISVPIVMLVQGWILLWATSYVTHWFTINYPFFWIGLLMSIAFGLLRIPSTTSTTNKNTPEIPVEGC